MAPLYQLDRIRKNYGNREALAIDELTIQPGRCYTLTGPNGSGKSTLLQILAFLAPPTAGRLLFCGEAVVWENGPLLRLRRQVTLLHQAPYLFSTSVQANVAFGLKTRGITGTEQRLLVDEALETVQLAGFQKRKAQELSGGEAQRVAMARALALRPKVLLLDEPLANVDGKSTELLEEVIVSLPARGTSVIITTHDPEHRQRFGTDRIHLVAGRPAAPPQPAILHKGETADAHL
ncbi:MAG TPA: ABC transporter ATP-binding protein [Geobacteraceae bacterium]